MSKPPELTIKDLVIGNTYHTIFGRAIYNGKFSRSISERLAQDKSDNIVYKFRFIEANWELPEAQAFKHSFIDTDQLQTRMMPPDIYLCVKRGRVSSDAEIYV